MGPTFFEKQSNKNKFLYVSIILFALASAYTTQVGISLLWQGDNWLIREGLALVIAIAISSTLVYISMQIPEALSEGKGYTLILGYLLIGLLSVLFNFNAFYSRQAIGTEIPNRANLVKEEAGELSSEVARYLNAEVNTIQSLVDSLSGELEAEKSHPNRPGRGKVYFEINRQFQVASKELSTIMSKKNVLLPAVDSSKQKIINLLNVALGNGGEKKMNIAIDSSYTLFGQLVTNIESELIEFEARRLPPRVNMERLESSMTVLFNWIKGTGEYSDDQKSQVVIALIFSLILDFPIFFLLVILNWQPTKKDKTKIDVSDDKTRRENEKNDILGNDEDLTEDELFGGGSDAKRRKRKKLDLFNRRYDADSKSDSNWQ